MSKEERERTIALEMAVFDLRMRNAAGHDLPIDKVLALYPKNYAAKKVTW